MRSTLILAGPVNNAEGERFANLEDRKKEQRDGPVLDFMAEVRTLSLSEEHDQVRCRAFAQPLFNLIFQETLQSDVAFAVFSVTFVLLYIWFHLSSFFMACSAMLLILLSFPVSYFIYTGIFQITMNTTLN